MDIIPRKKYYIYPQRKCLKYVQLQPCAQWVAINQKKKKKCKVGFTFYSLQLNF